jgi:nicotinamidase/pyrazinamidase
MKYDSETALIVVDVQNDFADPKGSLYVKGGKPSFRWRTVRLIRRGGPVHWSSTHKTGAPKNTPHFEKDGGIWPVHA